MYHILIFLSVFTNSLIFTVVQAEAESHNCKSGSTLPDDLNKQYTDWISEDEGMHPSFQIMPRIFWQNGNPDKNASITRRNYHLTMLSGDRSCPRKMSITSNLNDRALCPWYFLLNYDENRYPAILATVQCKCKNCYRRNGDETSDRQVLLPSCQKIPYRMKVLKQKFDKNDNKVCDRKGVYVFVRTYETVHIGCTCAVPKNDIIAPRGKYVTTH